MSRPKLHRSSANEPAELRFVPCEFSERVDPIREDLGRSRREGEEEVREDGREEGGVEVEAGLGEGSG